jgi:hypothetical protein
VLHEPRRPEADLTPFIFAFCKLDMLFYA